MLPAPASTTTQEAKPNDKDLPGEPADHAVGRSRGGWTTKIHALTDELCAPVTMLLSPGQAGDNPMLVPLLDAHPDRLTGDKRLLGDKAHARKPGAGSADVDLHGYRCIQSRATC